MGTVEPRKAADKGAPESVLARILRMILLIFVVLFVLALLGTGLEQLVFLVINHAGFGWLHFLIRVIPAIHVNPMAIITALVCVVLLLVGAHIFLTWLARAWQAGQTDAVPWRKRWTVSLVSLILLVFVAGTTMVGITHQVAWLSTSPDSWTKSTRYFPIILVNQYAYEIKDLRTAGKPLPAAALQRMCRKAAADEMRIVVLNDKDGLPWFVAVGTYKPDSSNKNSGAFIGWVGKGEEMNSVRGSFTSDQWAALIAEAEAGRSLEKFRH
jgi:hypothetical protein